MGVKSRTPGQVKLNGQAKKTGNGRSKDHVVISRAAAIMADKPLMRPATALRRAGAASAAVVKRLSKVLTEREQADASRAGKEKKSTAAYRSEPQPSRATSTASRASARKGPPKQARKITIGLHHEELTKTPTLPQIDAGLMLSELGSARIAELAAVGTHRDPKRDDLLSAFNGIHMRYWGAMFQWSPVGIMLRQTVAVTRLFYGPTDEPKS